MNSLKDALTFLQLGSVIYAFIIFYRGIQVLARNRGLRFNQDAISAIAVVGVILVFSKIGWDGSGAALLMATITIAVFTMFCGGASAGALLKKGFNKSLASLLLMGSTIIMTFVEPLLAVPLYTVSIGISVYLEYQDTYKTMDAMFGGNRDAQYIFIYPPLILLFTLTDVLVVSAFLGQVTAAIMVMLFTGSGIIYGYQKGYELSC